MCACLGMCTNAMRRSSTNLYSNERTLLSDAFVNAIQNVKYAIRVTVAGKAQQIPITPLMQARKTANSAM